MPLRAAMLAYPAMVILMMAVKSKSTAAKFIKAGAISPDTARKPGSLGIMWVEPIETALKSGVLRPAGDGRYYVDLPLHRRRRNLLIAALIFIGLAITAGLYVLWRVNG